jgi:hypothetical protein
MSILFVGGEIIVGIDNLRQYILYNLCNLLAGTLCSMDETEGNWRNKYVMLRVCIFIDMCIHMCK